MHQRMQKKILFSLFIIFNFSVFGQQTGNISGTITDKKDNSELIGVSVLIKGTSFGAATDLNGKFTIKNDKNKNNVVIYFGDLLNIASDAIFFQRIS